MSSPSLSWGAPRSAPCIRTLGWSPCLPPIHTRRRSDLVLLLAVLLLAVLLEL